MLKGKNIALYVTGGIAVYKVVDLMRSFIKKGANVRVAMTDSATKFVSPMTFQILSKNEVYLDTFVENEPEHVAHIDIADWTDVAVVAPATANTIAKMSYGLADNFVTSALLATRAPIFVVPAMNTDMYENKATQENLSTIKSRGTYVTEPDIGFLAEGYVGKGRFPEQERIIEELESFLIQYSSDLPLKGYKVLVSAGGTKERIDPVRYITNDSSGKTGHAIAKAAYHQGAEVILVTASDLKVPKGIQKVKVASAVEMYEAIDRYFEATDILIMSAAVSDYGMQKEAKSKIKKERQADLMTLELKKNPDILKTMGWKKNKQFVVGFAAETEKVEEYAKQKLSEKNLDMIVANDVSRKDTGFNVDFNEVVILTDKGQRYEVPKQEKGKIADVIMNKIIEELKNKR